ncbi:MAG: choice-of-anchor D domain-containing protein [Deltaproteobacteria bacterium]|nr:choice-of-anchor D domain-containing protein [Deltaproteobacteria bacterium]
MHPPVRPGLGKDFWAGLLLVAAGACECGEPLAELVPDVAVDPLLLDFGTIRPGFPSNEVVDVGNRGTGSLTIRSVTITPDDAGFALGAFPRKVAPGAAEPIAVELIVNAAGPASAELIIESDDEDTPRLVVPLVGEGGLARLSVSPDPLDFGLVNQGPGAARALTLLNEGLDNLTINSAAFADNSGFVVDAAGLPVNLAPDESVTVTVSLAPDAAMIAGALDSILRDTLVVTSSLGGRDVDVSALVNLAPIARVVERDSRRNPVKASVNEVVVVDGSETVDPEGDGFGYLWSVAVRPAGSNTALIGQGEPLVRVTPDVVGAYAVRLRATDERGAFDEADLELLPRDLAIVLSWAAQESAPCRAFSEQQCADFSIAERQQNCCDQSDLDVHLVAPGGVLGDYGQCPATCADVDFCAEESDLHVDTCRQTGLDCAFANRSPEWFTVGRADDPRLDIDAVSGGGPEVISLDEPADGIYRIVVHYCVDRSNEPSLATLSVFEQGLVLTETAPQAIVAGQAWVAAILERSGGSWNVVSVPDIFETDVPPNLCSP